MSEVFFIGDTHFGHRGIIQFSETAPHRPFATIEEHDAELVRRWNSAVGPKDVVWHLGDFCFGKRNLEIAAQLNGNKKLVLGNHDMYATEDYLRGPPESWPDWIVAARKVAAESPYRNDLERAYRYVIRDTIDRWHLYERVER